MKFIHPTFLWALLIIVIPIIIHLLNLRKFKPLLFPNVQFLNLVKEQTKKQSSVKRWVQLLLRCLAFSALVIAFARPYLPAQVGIKNNGKTFVCLYLDNSFSMQGKNETGNLFDQAKQEAINIIRSFTANTTFIISSNTNEIGLGKPCDANKAIQLIQQSKIGGQRKSFDAIQARQLQAIPDNAGQVFNFYLSDFQKNQFHADNILNDSIGSYFLIDFAHVAQQNVFIDSVWIERPSLLAGSTQNINIRIFNNTNADAKNYPVEVWIDGVKKQQLSVDIKAHSSNDFATKIKLPNKPIVTGKISITDYPITFDNEMLFAFNIQPNINVHTLYADNKSPLIHFFESDTIFKTTSSSFSNPNLAELEAANVIVLLAPTQISPGLTARILEWNAIGKTVILLPDQNSKIQNLNQLFNGLQIPAYGDYEKQKTLVNQWEFNHPIFENTLERTPKNVDYPTVSGYFKTITNQSTAIASIYNNPIIESFTVGSGQFYRVNASISKSSGNLGNHALFLTVLFRMGEMTNANGDIYYTVGSNKQINIDHTLQKDKVLSLVNDNETVIPYQLPKGNKTIVSLPETITNAGIYDLNSENKVINKLAINYNRLESSITFWDMNELTSQMQLFGLNTKTLSYKAEETINKIQGLTHNSVLWQYCLWIMLLFLSLEILLNKRW